MIASVIRKKSSTSYRMMLRAGLHATDHGNIYLVKTSAPGAQDLPLAFVLPVLEI